MTAPADEPILIAGGGIAGLSLAIALAREGIASRVLERSPAFTEVGAGIQLGPNAMHILRRLGVADALAPYAAEPGGIHINCGRTGRPLQRLPLGSWIADRHGAPYWTVHRADLHRALQRVVRAHADRIEVVLAFEAAEIGDDGTRVTVGARDGRVASGRALVGADGVWSAVRRRHFDDGELQFSGKIAARAVMARGAAPLAGGDAADTAVWLAPGAHLVRYPVTGREEIATVVILTHPLPDVGWAAHLDQARLLEATAGFAPQVREMLAGFDNWRAWALYDPAPLAVWSRGRVGLIGDAAHPVLPFLAQGGVMAIEDAAILALLLARAPFAPAVAFTDFEKVRRERVLAVQAASRRNGAIYHLSGPAGYARDLALVALPPSRVMAGYDWLYGWRVETALAAAGLGGRQAA